MKRILISGASIAGPTLAYWLHRYGFEVTVVERAPELRTGGQAVDVRGSAREVIELMGLMPSVRARHTGTVGIRVVDAANRERWRWGAELSGHSGGIIADLEILRTDLARILYDATTPGVEYVFGDSITDLRQHDEGVDVTFSSGAERRFDVVVGADGLHSRVRRLAFGPEPDYVRDQGYYKVIFAAETGLDLGGWQAMHVLPGRRRASLYPTATGQTRGMFFFAAPPVAYDRGDTRAQKKIVAEAFAECGWEIPRMVESMWETSDFYFDRESMVSVPEWSRGRAVLVGDAVSGGSAGMGTSMAIVAAYVLAGELAASDGDHARAFAEYRRKLGGYVSANQKPMPGGVKLFLPRSAGVIWLGDQLTRLMLAGPWRRKLTGDLGGNAESVTLEKYLSSVQTVDEAR
ncbi:FAD-binding monooxygenase [Amycolatopsis acidicola]|uniref:FAD-binding monooxygenase n=1 Tax=Amycolatopsis acidicola TaxID=2596893 RepID=A0A5N0UTB3_9PSEU|nr:FAD-dependent monooxygenase [Amycolatopsis acidicola]KAA9153242.1 FAD-binding monooxygenase [Amycolatopsis acidicola]